MTDFKLGDKVHLTGDGETAWGDAGRIVGVSQWLTGATTYHVSFYNLLERKLERHHVEYCEILHADPKRTEHD